eukprot:SAG31_NODE_5029_length_2794_cov_1.742115_1_plen_68_part_10
MTDMRARTCTQHIDPGCMASHGKVTFWQGFTRMFPSGVTTVDPAGVLSEDRSIDRPVGVVKLQVGACT